MGKSIIQGVFDFLAVMFDKIPVLSKLKGYRSAMGLVGLGIIAILKAKGVGDAGVLDTIELGLIAFSALALNSNGRLIP